MKDKLVEKLYEFSKKPYQKYFKKNQPWPISKTDLLMHNPKTLGYELGNFLEKNNFEIQSKLEDHDVIHVLTNTGTSVIEEIGMQFYLLGNGKKSMYLLLVIATGTCFYPTRIQYFINQYHRGKLSHQFHQLDFSKMLHFEILLIQNTFNIH